MLPYLIFSVSKKTDLNLRLLPEETEHYHLLRLLFLIYKAIILLSTSIPSAPIDPSYPPSKAQPALPFQLIQKTT